MFDHSNLFVKESWYRTMDAQAWCSKLAVQEEDSDDCLNNIRPRVETVAV